MFRSFVASYFPLVYVRTYVFPQRRLSRVTGLLLSMWKSDVRMSGMLPYVTLREGKARRRSHHGTTPNKARRVDGRASISGCAQSQSDFAPTSPITCPSRKKRHAAVERSTPAALLRVGWYVSEGNEKQEVGAAARRVTNSRPHSSSFIKAPTQMTTQRATT